MKNMSYINAIIRLFRGPSDQKIANAINAANVRNLRRFSLVIILLETVSIILYMAVNLSSPELFQTVCSISFCIISCVLVEIISGRLIMEYDSTGVISNRSTIVLVTVSYLLMSIWGIIVDARHYSAGEQMMTFYIVQFCFVCFVAVRPKIDSFLIALSFITFYTVLWRIDGAAGLQPLNVIVFSIIAIFGNAIKYSTLLETEQNNAKIRELNQYLQQEVTIDDLTKVKNRKALRNDMDHFLGKNICVIMADIDHFKKYNDTYGHLTGDKVLSRTAEVSEEAFKNGDIYRYGGDEFLFILPGCTDEECRQEIQRWNLLVSEIKISEIGEQIKFSYGLSSGVINSYDDFRTILKTADDRLYTAKGKIK